MVVGVKAIGCCLEALRCHQLARRFIVTLPLAKWDILILTLLLLLSLTFLTHT